MLKVNSAKLILYICAIDFVSVTMLISDRCARIVSLDSLTHSLMELSPS
jgi:hypothetical protein